MWLRSFLLFALLLTLAGCKKEAFKVAPVSGRVTLDGKPLSKATVTFVPLATKENINPGPTALGLTDDDGRYTLGIRPDYPGTVVGKCRIYISTVLTDPATDERDGGPPLKRPRDRVPERYNQRTELTFDVPAGGTDQANFELESK
jgi:hypothetical protein